MEAKSDHTPVEFLLNARVEKEQLTDSLAITVFVPTAAGPGPAVALDGASLQLPSGCLR
jgi:hypothetical protein